MGEFAVGSWKLYIYVANVTSKLVCIGYRAFDAVLAKIVFLFLAIFL